MSNSIKSKSKTKQSKHLPKFPWSAVADDLKRRGRWVLLESTPEAKIFGRGNEKLVAVKLRHKFWKAEYFLAGRLMDTSGMADEEFVKLMIYEMGVYRR